MIFLDGKTLERLQDHLKVWPSTSSAVVARALEMFFDANTPRPQSEARRDQRGMVLAWCAMTLLALVSFLALGVNLSKLCAQRAMLSATCDAAALSAATALGGAPRPGPRPRHFGMALDRAEAVRRALETAAMNQVYRADQDPPGPALLDASDVSFPSDSEVEVAFTGEMRTHFAPELPRLAPHVSATAVHGARGVRLIR